VLKWPETLDERERTEFKCAGLSNPFAPILFFNKNSSFRLMALVMLVEQFAGQGLGDVIFQYVKYSFNAGQSFFAAAYACFLVFAALGSGVLVPLAKTKLGFSDARMILIGLIGMAVSFTFWGFLINVPCFFIGAAMFAFSRLIGPGSISMMSNRIGDNEQGLMSGAFASVGSLSNLVALAIFPSLFIVGKEKLETAALPMWFALGLTIISIIAAYFLSNSFIAQELPSGFDSDFNTEGSQYHQMTYDGVAKDDAL